MNENENKYHVFASDHSETDGALDNYRGFVNSLNDAWEIAKSYDWAEVAQAEQGGSLIFIARKENRTINLNDSKRQIDQGFATGEGFVGYESWQEELILLDYNLAGGTALAPGYWRKVE